MANEGGKSGDFDERADRRRVEHVVLHRAEVLANAMTGGVGHPATRCNTSLYTFICAIYILLLTSSI